MNKNFFLVLHIFESTLINTKIKKNKNNFYVVKRELPAEKDIIFYLYVQLMLVFAVSFTPETLNFRTFGGVAHPPLGF